MIEIDACNRILPPRWRNRKISLCHCSVFYLGPQISRRLAMNLGNSLHISGLTGQNDHKEVQKVVDESLKRISARGKISGAIGNKSNVKSLYENGVKFYLCDPRPYMSNGFQKYQDFAQKALEK